MTTTPKPIIDHQTLLDVTLDPDAIVIAAIAMQRLLMFGNADPRSEVIRTFDQAAMIDAAAFFQHPDHAGTPQIAHVAVAAYMSAACRSDPTSYHPTWEMMRALLAYHEWDIHPDNYEQDFDRIVREMAISMNRPGGDCAALLNWFMRAHPAKRQQDAAT